MKSNASSETPRKAATPAAGRTSCAGFVEGYLPALLGLAGHSISAEFHKTVRRHKLSVAEWHVLATVASVPDDEECSMARLAEFTGSKQPTLTRLLDRMVKAGHVERRMTETDRRFTYLRLTRSGQAVVGDLVTLARKHEAAVLRDFDDRTVEFLKAILVRLIAQQRKPDRAGRGKTRT